MSRSRESDLVDADVDIATGIGLIINIGHKCNHTTGISAPGSHTRIMHVMDDGSNDHVGNDSRDDLTAISGASRGTHYYPWMCIYIYIYVYLQTNWLAEIFCFSLWVKLDSSHEEYL